MLSWDRCDTEGIFHGRALESYKSKYLKCYVNGTVF